MKSYLSRALVLLLVMAQAPAARPAAGAPPTPRPSPAAARQPAQQAAPAQTPAEDSDEDVVRITTNLVQFDAVVTDKQGRHVTDLRPEDFEVLVDGKRQEVSNFSFVTTEPAATREAAPAARPDKSAPPLPPVPLRHSQVRRTIALVVDDLGTSFSDLVYVRQALKKFVDEQMQPGDLVAVMRTSAGVGALQQFTNDRQLLHRAIERVRWNPQGRAGISTFAPIEADPLAQAGPAGGGGRRPGGGVADRNPGERDDRDAAADLEEFRQGVFTVGTLGAIDFVVRGMKELPGRKSVVVFSAGFSIFRDPRSPNDLRSTDRILESLRRLTDQANRASVIIYTMDARGLVYTGLTAADSAAAGRVPGVSAFNERNEEVLRNQEGLAYLAEQTGGIFIKNTNDLGGGMRRVLEDQKGYYLIGFRPSVDLFEPLQGRTRFNKFEVRVRRAGLRVRTRAGFYGYAEAPARSAPRTRGEQILAALTSPITSGELSLRLTSLFNSPAARTIMVDSLLHIDASQLKLTDEPDGWKKAVVDVVAVTFGENGQVVDEINRTETVRARGDALRLMLSQGLVYVMKVPVKKPGAYQLRVAVRDAATEKLGSASQFIEVPDLRKEQLALSGIFITTADEAPAPKAGAAAAPPTSRADPLREATLRRFSQGTQVDILYHIYNAKVDRATGRPRLHTQARLFRDGQPVFTGAALPYDPGQQTDMSHLQAGHRLRLGTQLAPGDYVLQIIVTDELARAKRRTSTQWIDFEIVK